VNVKSSKSLRESVILILMPVLFFITIGVLVAGCQDEQPDGNSIGKEEVQNNMEQFEDKKITVPPIDQDIPARLATATLAMG